MRHFIFRCRQCGHTVTLRVRAAPSCCGKPMGRDYKAESAKVAYHPTKGK